METEELIELRKEARDERQVGVTMAIAAAFLAMATLMGHRLHTEEVVMQTKSADGWAFYQAKNNRSHMFENDATLARLIASPAAGEVVADWTRKAAEERQQADEIRRENERLDRETEGTARRATFFDVSEIGLEVGIVLCSITLLTKSLLFWRLSFLPMLVGLGTAVSALIVR